MAHGGIKGPALFEKMACAGNNLQLFFAGQCGQSAFVQFDHLVIEAANYQQCWGSDVGKITASQIRPSAARNTSSDPVQ